MVYKFIKTSILFKSAGIYTITNLLNASIPFFLMPILTRYLNPFEYGLVSMFGVLIGLVGPFIGVGVHGAVARQYYEKKVNIAEYVFNCILILICSTFIVSIVFYFFSEFISNISAIPEKWLWAVILVSLGNFITQLVLTHWQVQIKPLPFGAYRILQTLLNAGLSVWLVVFLEMGWQGRISGQILTSLIFIFFSFYVLSKNKWIVLKYNKQYIKNALNFGLPLLPHLLGGFIITMIDRIFITNMVGVAETGIYTVGYQIGMIINLLATSFNQAWVPWFYSKLKQNNKKLKLKIVKYTYIYFIVIIIISLLLSGLAPWFMKYFIGESFKDSSKYVFWIALGYSFQGMYFMVTNYIFYVQKNYYLSAVTFFTALCNIVLNYLLIKLFGAIGAAQATTISYFISFILTWIVSARIYEMPWIHSKIFQIRE